MTTHIYVNDDERYLVELRVSYPHHDGAPEHVGVHSPKHAAAAALALTTDDGRDGTIWVVTDRQTGTVHQFEQGDLEDEEIT